MKKRIFSLFAALLLLLSGCVGPDQQPAETAAPAPAAEEEKHTLSLAVYDFDTFNPIVTGSQSVLEIAGLLYEGLMSTDGTGMPVCALAESYTVSDDGLTYEFDLRSDVFWHDGTRFTAYDVAYTISCIQEYESMFRPAVSLIDTSEVAGENVFRVTLQRPASGFINEMTFPIIKDGTDCVNNLAQQQPIGTGPYRYVRQEAGKTFRLVRNEQWVGGVAQIEAISIKVMPDAQAELYALEAGEIDAASISAKDLMRYNPKGNLKSVSYTDRNFSFIGINTTRPGLNTVQVRQAMSLLIDRDRISKNVMFGRMLPVSVPAAPDSWLYDNPNVESMHDVNAALALLEAEGYTQFESDIRYRQEEEQNIMLHFELLVNEENEIRRAAAEEIAKCLKEAGIQIDVVALRFSDYQNRIEAGRYDLFLGEVSLDNWNDWSIFAGSSARYSVYSSENIDYLLQSSQQATQLPQIQEAYHALCRAFLDEMPIISLYFGQASLIYDSSITGDIRPVFQNIYGNISQWQKQQ